MKKYIIIKDEFTSVVEEICKKAMERSSDYTTEINISQDFQDNPTLSLSVRCNKSFKTLSSATYLIAEDRDGYDIMDDLFRKAEQKRIQFEQEEIERKKPKDIEIKSEEESR